MNLLAVRTHAFGDALMCTPAVAALSTVHAVSVLTGPSALPVWSRMPGIESVITAPIPANPLSLLFWTMSHRLAGFDRVIFFGVSPVLRRWLRLMTRAAMRSGADLPLGSWEEAVGFGEKPAALAFSRIAGVAPESLRPVFPLKDQEKAIAGKMAEQGSYAVIAPGGGRNPRQSVSAKRISPEKWREGIVFLRGKGYKVLGVGAAGDRETVAAAGVDVNLAGSCSWGVTAALIAGAAVFAGNDSGPAHLAVAHEVPIPSTRRTLLYP